MTRALPLRRHFSAVFTFFKSLILMVLASVVIGFALGFAFACIADLVTLGVMETGHSPQFSFTSFNTYQVEGDGVLEAYSEYDDFTVTVDGRSVPCQEFADLCQVSAEVHDAKLRFSAEGEAVINSPEHLVRVTGPDSFSFWDGIVLFGFIGSVLVFALNFYITPD